MTMHEHDIDLIMAVADGSLSGPAGDAATAEIAACSTCSEDLALQRSALSYLRETPRAYLTATESAALRSGVRESLDLKPEPAPSEPSWWMRRRLSLGALAGAAAVLLAIVAAAPALDLLGGGTADDDATLAVAPPRTESALDSAQSAPTAEPTPGNEELSAGAVPESLPEDATAVAELPTGDNGMLPPDLDLLALKAELEGASRQELAMSDSAPGAELDDPGRPSGDGDEVSPAPAVSPPTNACDPESVDGIPPESTPTIIGPIDRDGTPGQVVAYFTPEGRVTVVILDAITCEIIESA